jgi:hypothetical protein
LSTPNRLSFIRSVRIAKRYVEHNVGISLGDAVNLALFALTITSLLIALAGVGIAWITYVEASKSGKNQERDLKSAADSLFTAKTSLDASNTQLTALNNQLATSILIQKSQQANLETAVSLSNRQLQQLQQQQKNVQSGLEISASQLAQLKKQTEIASRRPDGTMVVYCDPAELPGDTDHRLNAGVGIPRKVNGPETGTLWTDSHDEVMCYVLFSNYGTANLTDATARLKIRVLEPKGPFSIRYSLQDVDEVPKQASVSSEVTDQSPTIDLVRGFTINPTGSLFHSLQLEMWIPKEVQIMTLTWEFGGNEQSLQDDESVVLVEHSLKKSQ